MFTFLVKGGAILTQKKSISIQKVIYYMDSFSINDYVIITKYIFSPGI
jgi:hypothetical protein